MKLQLVFNRNKTKYSIIQRIVFCTVIFFISTIFEGIGAENQEKILKKKEEDMFQKIEGCLLESKVAYQDTALFIRPAEKIRYPPKNGRKAEGRVNWRLSCSCVTHTRSLATASSTRMR